MVKVLIEAVVGDSVTEDEAGVDLNLPVSGNLVIVFVHVYTCTCLHYQFYSVEPTGFIIAVGGNPHMASRSSPHRGDQSNDGQGSWNDDDLSTPLLFLFLCLLFLTTIPLPTLWVIAKEV